MRAAAYHDQSLKICWEIGVPAASEGDVYLALAGVALGQDDMVKAQDLLRARSGALSHARLGREVKQTD